ncbi:MAG: LON peptidase substrate-binding domain-containing protein [Acidimicrobiia bacterium]|nr:LON peptidase substrate-binding domain-containing protein [Acidimicrobiia bacterium]
MRSRIVPMFPLGSVLLPSMVLPLHVFEPRYRTMMEVVMAEPERSFGVVLIERGHEVGGADQRSAVGTLARVIDTERSEDGRWGVLSVGVGRIRIEEWLPDDPYPQALVSDWPDDSVASEQERMVYQELLAAHRRLLGLTAELGYDVGPVQDLSDDPTLGGFQIAATAPLSTFDRQQVLAANTLDDRLPILKQMLGSALELAELELQQAMMDPMGDDGD